VVQIGGRRDEAERAADVYGVAAGGAAGTPNELKGAFALAWFVQLARYVTYTVFPLQLFFVWLLKRY
jgi:hypothetical protein